MRDLIETSFGGEESMLSGYERKNVKECKFSFKLSKIWIFQQLKQLIHLSSMFRLIKCLLVMSFVVF